MFHTKETLGFMGSLCYSIDMLSHLTIQNIVLISSLTIEFQDGLCTLTGETGAGKSILLDSLGLALGSRAEARLVRRDCEQAQVTAMFDLPPAHPVFEALRENDLNCDEGELILRRTLKADGRSKAFINDQPVSISLLSQIGEMIVEIHSQFETHGLLNAATHRAHLDDFASLNDLSFHVEHCWNDWRTAQKRFDEAEQNADKARAEEEFLRQSLEDLDALSPKENEEDELTALRERLMSREQILEALNIAYNALNGEEDPVHTALRALDRIADKAGDDLTEPLEALDRAQVEIQEASSQIESLSLQLSESEYNLQEIDDRLFALKGQARKHGCTIADLPAKREELAHELNMIEHGDEVLSGLLQKVNQARRSYCEQAELLSKRRYDAAQKLDQSVGAELPPLKMEKARFVTQVDRLPEDEWTSHGIDKIQFLVATNTGSDPGPLGKIASGGEMARFMLALKVIMAEVGSAQTLVFDEVDSGIGGATADAVGERLARLGASRQVLVVTHSPQVAARAAHHWIVHKDGTTESTTTNILHLNNADHRREEIARMLSGAEITEEARKAAEKLLQNNKAA